MLHGSPNHRFLLLRVAREQEETIENNKRIKRRRRPKAQRE